MAVFLMLGSSTLRKGRKLRALSLVTMKDYLTSDSFGGLMMFSVALKARGYIHPGCMLWLLHLLSNRKTRLLCHFPLCLLANSHSHWLPGFLFPILMEYPADNQTGQQIGSM